MEPHTKKVVLIAEDEAVYQRILTEKLAPEGFEVITAKNGEEGIALALAKHPDLILLDLVMPGMDGIDMAHRLRQDEWGKTAKIVILTNLTDMEKIQQALENEIFEYFIKSDVDLEYLVEKIKEMVK